MPTTIEEKLDYVSRLTERMLVKLFGDVDGETPTGRMPMIEARQADHEKCIRSLEKTVLKVAGAIALLGILAGVLEAAARLASAMRH